MVRFSRTPAIAGLVVAFLLCFAPQVLATDISDIGYVDQSALGQLPPFVAAQQQYAQYQQNLAQQFQAAIKGKSQPEQQQIYQNFNNQAAQKQRDLFGPLLGRAQAAIASVAANRGLSVVVDKTIVIYGGLDITQDVISMLNQPGPILPPVNSPPPSEVGYVDQTQLDALPKAKQANDTFLSFRQTLATQLASQSKGKSDAERAQLAQSLNSQLDDEQKKVLQPVIDATNAAIAGVAKQKHLLLVIDAGNRVYGGTDVTADVVKALQ
ncbi:MAG TPA: OmpH family outer membrane protein [Candidatus Acidoferrales bacterium]|nr:OmpH family outer membrane protein [Candidatus Acidoferrales bacterium]